MMRKAIATGFKNLFQKPQYYTSGLLKKRFAEILPQYQNKLKEVKQKYGNEIIAPVKVEQVIGGMRNMFGLLWDTSLLDARTGITMRGYSIPELSEFLPKAIDEHGEEGEEPLPEGLLWLLLTNEFPTKQEFSDLQGEIKERGKIGDDVKNYIKNLPKDMHTMTQLSSAILYLQRESLFAKAYAQGVHKSQYWESCYEDSLNLIAKIPTITALIYRHTYFNDDFIESDLTLDWAGNFSHMLGYDKWEMKECLRGYLSIHSDHEGGNVSAHTTHLVGSALSDPYLSYSAGVNGLAGPLHGLANQEVLRWLQQMMKDLGEKPTDEQIKEYTMNTLSEGKVIPGYGHAVLRHTDPRFLHQKQFAARNIKNDPIIRLVKQCYRVIPMILKNVGKIKNPWPNVDAHSGALLQHYGLDQYEFYTAIFAVSRAIGCLSSLIWSRAYGLPIERPQSVTIEWIENRFSGARKYEK